MLLAPNWMGMTDNAIQRGELVTANRYVVFVADMYGAGTRPADFGEAAALANPLRLNAVEQRRRVKAAFETMIAQAKTRNLIDDRRAAVGFLLWRRQRPGAGARWGRFGSGRFDPW